MRVRNVFRQYKIVVHNRYIVQYVGHIGHVVNLHMSRVRVCSRVSVCVRVCPHVSACVTVCPRVSLCIRVCPRVSLCVRVCPRVSASVTVSHCVSACVRVCSRESVCVCLPYFCQAEIQPCEVKVLLSIDNHN